MGSDKLFLVGMLDQLNSKRELCLRWLAPTIAGCPSLPVATNQFGHGRNRPPCGAPTSGDRGSSNTTITPTAPGDLQMSIPHFPFRRYVVSVPQFDFDLQPCRSKEMSDLATRFPGSKRKGASNTMKHNFSRICPTHEIPCFQMFPKVFPICFRYFFHQHLGPPVLEGRDTSVALPSHKAGPNWPRPGWEDPA